MSKQLKQNDVVVEMLKFGKEKITSGFTQKDLTDYLSSQGIDPDQLVVDLYFREYFQYYVPPQTQNQQGPATSYLLNPKGYFDLLQIESTFESRRLSESANWIAIGSFILAVLAVVISLF